MERSGLDGGDVKRHLALAVIASVIVGAMASSTHQASVSGVDTGYAGSPSNLDVFESGNSLYTTWFSAAHPLTQRYGCTDVLQEPDSAPTGYCDSSHPRWHHGIDIDSAGTSLPIYSAVEGSIASYSPGFLAILTNNGNVVYLLHGTAHGGYSHPNTVVHVGDYIYDTGTLGLSTGFHLHLEVRSKPSDTTYSTGPWDDINPEGWLWPLANGYAQQLASWQGPPSPRLDHFSIRSVGPGNFYLDRYASAGSSWSLSEERSVQADGTVPVAISVYPWYYDVFMTGASGGGVTWVRYHQGTWDQVALSPPGATTIAPGAISAVAQGFYKGSDGNSYQRIYLVALDTNGYAWSRLLLTQWSGTSATYTDYGWSSCNPPSGIACSAPAPLAELRVVSFDAGNLAVVGRTTTGYIYMTGMYNWNFLSSWISPTSDRQGTFLPGLAVTTYQGTWNTTYGVIDIYARSNAFSYVNLVHLNYGCSLVVTPAVTCNNQNNWESAWDGNVSTTNLFTPTADFAAFSWSDFRSDLVVRDTNGKLWWTAWDPHYPSAWFGWSQPQPAAPDALYADLSAVTWGYGEVDIPVYQNDNHFRQERYSTSPSCSGSPCWNGWYLIY